MSEYQYYEFRAIDRPLDRPAMTALREITSRAEITSTSLINEYHWGDFKGDVDELMQEYFDAHLYLANWGTHQLMLRLPIKLFPLSAVKPYATASAALPVPSDLFCVADKTPRRHPTPPRPWPVHPPHTAAAPSLPPTTPPPPSLRPSPWPRQQSRPLPGRWRRSS